MNIDTILKELKKLRNPQNVEGMARYGINTEFALGINIPFLRNKAKEIGKNHELAIQLWETKIHEARLLAAFLDEPKLISRGQMNKWASGFNSWDLCDQVCNHLFRKTDFAYDKAVEWSKKKKEFVKRAGFVLMASLAVHSKELTNDDFLIFFKYIKSAAIDERNYVKKAVNWAVRQIGKRNLTLHKKALQLSEEILKLDTKTSSWIAKNAIHELQSKKTISRIKS
ncbi:MAG: DNA alkylation repair protein [Ignavibacteria bacterium]